MVFTNFQRFEKKKDKLLEKNAQSAEAEQSNKEGKTENWNLVVPRTTGEKNGNKNRVLITKTRVYL